MTYNWQRKDWPSFLFDLSAVAELLHTFAERSGRVEGLLEGLPSDLGAEAVLQLMISEAIKSSAIEGEILDPEEVMSSIRNQLGMNVTQKPVRSRKADGAGRLMVAVRSDFAEPLNEETLFEWHRMLLGSVRGLRVGAWRIGDEPMQIVSGSLGKRRVHFEAPHSMNVPAEMAGFITWFNETAPDGCRPISQAPVRAAIAHLYFESIHPFDDGNGRIGRAISEKALSQGLRHPVALSLSRVIEAERKAYYDALNEAQHDSEVTSWVTYFVNVVLRSQIDAEDQIRFVLKKWKFFQTFAERLNARQERAARRMFDAGPSGYIGGMSARKYMAITGASKATATRDLHDLAAMGALVPVGSGRSARYDLH